MNEIYKLAKIRDINWQKIATRRTIQKKARPNRVFCLTKRQKMEFEKSKIMSLPTYRGVGVNSQKSCPKLRPVFSAQDKKTKIEIITITHSILNHVRA